MRISDWSSDVCSSDLVGIGQQPVKAPPLPRILVKRPGEQDRRGEARRECGFGEWRHLVPRSGERQQPRENSEQHPCEGRDDVAGAVLRRAFGAKRRQEPHRSEEHTSELQSLMRISYAVFCLKKTNNYYYLDKYNNETH